MVVCKSVVHMILDWLIQSLIYGRRGGSSNDVINLSYNSKHMYSLNIKEIDKI